MGRDYTMKLFFVTMQGLNFSREFDQEINSTHQSLRNYLLARSHKRLWGTQKALPNQEAFPGSKKLSNIHYKFIYLQIIKGCHKL